MTRSVRSVAIKHCTTSLVLHGARKGRGGTVAVMGGSTVYSGAPFIASSAALRAGAELVYLHTEASAAAAIKALSPDLCVHPSWSGSPGARCVRKCVCARAYVQWPLVSSYNSTPCKSPAISVACMALAEASSGRREWCLRVLDRLGFQGIAHHLLVRSTMSRCAPAIE